MYLVTNAIRFGSGFQPNAVAAPLIAYGDEKFFKTASGDRFTQALHRAENSRASARNVVQYRASA